MDVAIKHHLTEILLKEEDEAIGGKQLQKV